MATMAEISRKLMTRIYETATTTTLSNSPSNNDDESNNLLFDEHEKIDIGACIYLLTYLSPFPKEAQIILRA